MCRCREIDDMVTHVNRGVQSIIVHEEFRQVCYGSFDHQFQGFRERT